MFYKPLSHRKKWLGIILILLLTACGSAENGAAPSVESDATDESAVTQSSASAQVDNLETTDTTAARFSPEKYADYEIITLLPRDAIPAIDDPQFMNVEEANAYYDPDELVIGVEFNGDARAYSVPYLSNHEIVNDTVGGVKIAVTW